MTTTSRRSVGSGAVRCRSERKAKGSERDGRRRSGGRSPDPGDDCCTRPSESDLLVGFGGPQIETTMRAAVCDGTDLTAKPQASETDAHNHFAGIGACGEHPFQRVHDVRSVGRLEAAGANPSSLRGWEDGWKAGRGKSQPRNVISCFRVCLGVTLFVTARIIPVEYRSGSHVGCPLTRFRRSRRRIIATPSIVRRLSLA